MTHIGLLLKKHIENQYGTINDFASSTGVERQGVYQDCRREDVNTKRLRIILKALKLDFSDFFKNFELGEIPDLPRRTTPPLSFEAERLVDSYEARLKEKDLILAEKERLIASQQELIDILKANK